MQWCGLVYADALYRLARYHEQGPWKQIAEGITASGIQQSWTQEDPDRVGLLPDFYYLRAQVRDGPAINPGTVQANAIRLLGGPDVYDFVRLPDSGLILHAPGPIVSATEAGGIARFECEPWEDRQCFVLLSGLTNAPAEVRVNGAPVPAPEYHAAEGRLILEINGRSIIEVLTAAQRE